MQGPAGKYLLEPGVGVADFNSYGSRRGNHKVMVRGSVATHAPLTKIPPGPRGGMPRPPPRGEASAIDHSPEPNPSE